MTTSDNPTKTMEKWVRSTHHSFRVSIAVPEGFKPCPFPECHKGRIAGDPQDGDSWNCHICRGKGVIRDNLDLCPKCDGHLMIRHYGPCPECGSRGDYSKSCTCSRGVVAKKAGNRE